MTCGPSQRLLPAGNPRAVAPDLTRVRAAALGLLSALIPTMGALRPVGHRFARPIAAPAPRLPAA